jgi:hypothetical protein
MIHIVSTRYASVLMKSKGERLIKGVTSIQETSAKSKRSRG